MSSSRVLTALNVPTVTSYPSINSVQWSPDGQLCFVTKNAAYIMTPDHGINFDSKAVIRSTLSKDNREDDNALGWFRTIVQLDKSAAFRWPEYSQEWGAVSLGSMDVSLWAATFSPTNLSPDAGCILVTLSSNMDLTLWTGMKNCLKGEWIKIYDVTPYLTEIAVDDVDGPSTSQVLKAQVVSITWTLQADFGAQPAASVDGSLLICGSRGGTVIFFRYNSKQTLDHVLTLSVAEKWISHVAFTEWKVVEPGICEGYVAYGTSDGAVGRIKVTQALHESPSSYPFDPTISIKMSAEQVDEPISEPDKYALTGIRWIEASILVYCKPGMIYLWSPPQSDEHVWYGSQHLALTTHKLSSTSSCLHPVSGINYIRKTDILVLTLFDGAFYIVHNVSRDPSWIHVEAESRAEREALSRVARDIFVRTEGDETDSNDMSRMTGVVAYDGAGIFLWAHEASRPADFSYKHDARHNSMLVVAQMWDGVNDDELLKNLTIILANAKAASGLSPLALLRPFFIHLRNPKKINTLLPRFLAILHPNIDSDHTLSIRPPMYEGVLDSRLREEFRRSLSRHLFGWDVMQGMRMKLSLADFAWKLSDNEKKQEECGVVAQELLNSISHRILRTVIRHLMSVVDILTIADVPFVLRMVVQSLLPGSPMDLSAEGSHLSSLVKGIVACSNEAGEAMDNDVTKELNEHCPACKVEVPLQDIISAVCPNGHTWSRCSVTTFILATPFVRTCIGCGRKAFLPPSNATPVMRSMVPEVTQGWVVHELLEAVKRCLFCGNSFASVL
ncbi:transcription factor IIIC subunit delta N-term-domain-containing protein [Cyathus striatus]|nr:transcription factor IIIC subunit delta N-term-domain-containing protein [Cyathus striatus]